MSSDVKCLTIACGLGHVYNRNVKRLISIAPSSHSCTFSPTDDVTHWWWNKTINCGCVSTNIRLNLHHASIQLHSFNSGTVAVSLSVMSLQRVKMIYFLNNTYCQRLIFYLEKRFRWIGCSLHWTHNECHRNTDWRKTMVE